MGHWPVLFQILTVFQNYKICMTVLQLKQLKLILSFISTYREACWRQHMSITYAGLESRIYNLSVIVKHVLLGFAQMLSLCCILVRPLVDNSCSAAPVLRVTVLGTGMPVHY